MFPAELVPDESVTAPHHFYLIVAALPFLFVVWDNYAGKEPVLYVLFVLCAVAAFGLVWPWYPVAGALMTLTATCAALTTVVYHLISHPPKWETWALAAALVFVLVGVDDAADHAFRWWVSPPDYVWSEWIYPALPST